MTAQRLFPLSIVAVLLMPTACGGGSGGAAPPVSSPESTTSISALQGSDAASALVGQVVTISGVVTADFQENDGDSSSDLGGFYVQSESPDGDATTSEGVFVFDGDSPQTGVTPGDRVNVTGEVQEYFGETQIVAASVVVTGRGAFEAVDVMFPTARFTANSDGELAADLEAYEGMLVHFPQTLTVTDARNLERYGDLRLAEAGRLTQFTNSSLPEPDGYALHRQDNAQRSIILDDGRRSQNVMPVRYFENGRGNAVRVGSTVAGLTGVLRYSRGSGGNGAQTWRLMPVAEPQFIDTNPRPGTPLVAGRLRVAGVNVLNLFSGIDTGSDNCGPLSADGCRGADTPEELARQLAKLCTALAMMDADIVGLVELENNADASLQIIVGALNEQLGTTTYDFVDTGAIGNDAIRTGLIYKLATVNPVGEFAVLDNDSDARFNDDRSRPVLAQSFRELSSNARLTVAVAHLKSKGSDCLAEGDPNTGDGQGNCNQTRSNAALAMADWLRSDPTNSGDPDIVLLGDLNAYLQEDPVAALRAPGLVNLLDAAADEPYSFVFDGQSGALDHAIVSASLQPQVTGVLEWHINADEAPLHDYNLEHGRDPELFDPASPYRSSDHDPVIVGIDLN